MGSFTTDKRHADLAKEAVLLYESCLGKPPAEQVNILKEFDTKFENLVILLKNTHPIKTFEDGRYTADDMLLGYQRYTRVMEDKAESMLIEKSKELDKSYHKAIGSGEWVVLTSETLQLQHAKDAAEAYGKATGQTSEQTRGVSKIDNAAMTHYRRLRGMTITSLEAPNPKEKMLGKVVTPRRERKYQELLEYKADDLIADAAQKMGIEYNVPVMGAGRQ